MPFVLPVQPEGPFLIPLFGYFYIERGGLEIMLVRTESGGRWTFPIDTEFDVRTQDVNEAINNAVVEFCNDSRSFSRDNLLEAQLESPIVHKVLVGPSSRNPILTEGMPGYFFKIRLAHQQSTSPEQFRWEEKTTLFSFPDHCIASSLLYAISRSQIYIRYGFKIVECLDVLVFRKIEDEVSFLLLKREDPLRGFVGREYPKGPILYHETIIEGAIHRLAEETGTTSYEYCGYLGFQVVDVRDRKLNEYDTLKVHGVTFLYTGDEYGIQPTDRQVVLRNPIWVPWDQARQLVWMKPYGPEFFDRWLAKKAEILSNSL